MKVSANAPCPCGRDAKLKHCCDRYHRGRPAPPRALVRARYCAFVRGNARFILDTTHPTAPHHRDDRAAWKTEVQQYCRRVRFRSLTLHDGEVDETAGTAWVSFTVEMVDEGQPVTFFERSTFLRDGVRWRYVTGDIDTQ
ncbi:MAG: SEC-C domain-containing protein [Deltaproteobacteria bacterium]|nr:SEC-C domain-containing protein [Deltaproteobacteria bacterium]